MQAASPNENVFVQGLPATLTDEMVKAIFMQYGNVASAKIIDPVPGSADCAAVVQMSSVVEAQWIVDNINQNIPSGLATPVTAQFSESTASQAGSAQVNSTLAPGLIGAAAPASLPGTAVTTAIASLSNIGAVAGVATANAAVTPTTMPLGVMLSGTVKRWDSAKGFGFIVPDGGGPDVFVHARELRENEVLVNGSKVMFEAMLDPSKGPGRYRAKTCVGGVQKDAAAQAVAASDRLFMVGLPLEISEEQITQIFNQYGQVQSVKKLPNQTGKNDAAALVKMADAAQAKWLVENVNQNIPSGLTTPVMISFAENKQARQPNPFATPAAAPGYGPALGMPSLTAAQGPYGAAPNAADQFAAMASLYSQLPTAQPQLMGLAGATQPVAATAGFSPGGML